MLMLVEKKPECPPSQDGAPEGFAAPDVAAPPLQNELWLLGQPPLANLLDFVDSAVADPERFDRQALTAAWRRASAQYQALEVSQPGIANAGEHRLLDAALAPLADEVRAHPSFRLSFDTLPTTFAMVDLDHLIVDQQHVTHDFVDAITQRVGPRPDPRTLFRLCMLLEAPAAPVQIQKVGSRRFTFRTRSLDLRSTRRRCSIRSWPRRTRASARWPASWAWSWASGATSSTSCAWASGCCSPTATTARWRCAPPASGTCRA
ncbi:MAG: hypothetical protein U1F25_19400 [Rubrivivax sp.]